MNKTPDKNETTPPEARTYNLTFEPSEHTPEETLAIIMKQSQTVAENTTRQQLETIVTNMITTHTPGKGF